MPEVIRDGIEGLLVPPSDPALLAEALVAARLDPQLRERMGAAGDQAGCSVRSRRAWRRLEDIYDEVLAACMTHGHRPRYPRADGQR